MTEEEVARLLEELREDERWFSSGARREVEVVREEASRKGPTLGEIARVRRPQTHER